MANTSKRGFASMDPNKQREIASKGGRAAHAKGTAHEFTSDEARVAGRKGGEAVSRDRAHMSAIGREGGHSRGARARANQSNSGEELRSSSQSLGRQDYEGGRLAESANDRGIQNNPNLRPERNDRSDRAIDQDRFAGRDEI
jgi:general stress protein YciG